MRERHLRHEDIRRLIEVETSEHHVRLLLHHLSVCPECYREGGYILDLYEAGALPAVFSSVDLDLARSRAEAPALLEKLGRFDFKRQKALVKDTDQFRSWGLAETLCKESLKAAAGTPGKAVELAELAVLVSLGLREWEPAEVAWLEELRAFALSHLGNAHRVAGDLALAEAAFGEADERWQASFKDMGDVLGYGATIFALRASLRRTQGRFTEALSLLADAIEADVTGSLAPELLTGRGATYAEMGKLDAAVEAYREAVASLKPDSPLRLTYALHHNLVDALSKAGFFEEAAALLPEVQALGEKGEASPLDRIRTTWVEARIAAGLNDHARAYSLFDEVRRVFGEHALVLDAGLATLELATLYAEEGKHDLVQAIASDLLPLFQVQNLPREAVITLSLFCKAAEARVVSAELAAWTYKALEQARERPSGGSQG
jgi:tetratricopeptide (TPR) repeat protein